MLMMGQPLVEVPHDKPGEPKETRKEMLEEQVYDKSC